MSEAAALAEQRRRAYARDPWLWIRDCCWTVDEIDKAVPIKPFPVAVCVGCVRYAGGGEVAYGGPNRYLGGACARCGGPLKELTYLRLATRVFQAAGHGGVVPGRSAEGLTGPWFEAVPPILAFPKSRRMRMSWWAAAMHTHLALFNPHTVSFLVSTKEGKSGELLDRCQRILTRLTPGCMAPFTEVKAFTRGRVGWVPEFIRRDSPAPEIELPNGARIFAVPEGADQLRQYAATAILCDEIGTWKWPRESYVSMKPTTEGTGEAIRGQITLLSSAYPGFWAELVEGQLTA